MSRQMSQGENMPGQALREVCRINRAQLDALIEKQQAAEKAVVAHETFAQSVLADIIKLAGAIDTDGGRGEMRRVRILRCRCDADSASDENSNGEKSVMVVRTVMTRRMRDESTIAGPNTT
ncbi:hypothetical protein VE00_02930 [Pseudogymnoascus sp. WSF 3629]|nr:hypothetical protein VE00_02930 [Pseudogymnoascus sp. WSF 3629]